MSYELYRTFHLVGALLLAFIFGGMLIYYRQMAQNASDSCVRKKLAIFHGVSLVLLFVSGFGMLAKTGVFWPLPDFVWLKFFLWVLLGSAVVAIKRLPGYYPWILLPALLFGAAWLGIYKP